MFEKLTIDYRLCTDIEYMTNKRPKPIWRLCWKIISPALIVSVLVFSLRDLFTHTPTYQAWNAKAVSGVEGLRRFENRISNMCEHKKILEHGTLCFHGYLNYNNLTNY